MTLCKLLVWPREMAYPRRRLHPKTDVVEIRSNRSCSKKCKAGRLQEQTLSAGLSTAKQAQKMQTDEQAEEQQTLPNLICQGFGPLQTAICGTSTPSSKLRMPEIWSDSMLQIMKSK